LLNPAYIQFLLYIVLLSIPASLAWRGLVFEARGRLAWGSNLFGLAANALAFEEQVAAYQRWVERES